MVPGSQICYQIGNRLLQNVVPGSMPIWYHFGIKPGTKYGTMIWGLEIQQNIKC